MANHPNRNLGYVIRLANGRLWKPQGASGAAIFRTRHNARETIAGFSGRGALADPSICKLFSGPRDGAVWLDGYWMESREGEA